MKIFALATATIMLASSAALAETAEISTEFETSLASTYVFRGAPQYESKLDPSSQSSVGVSMEGVGPGALSVSIWNATAISNYGNQPDTRLEFDITVGYAFRVADAVDVGVGYIAYLYPDSDPVDAAHEVALTVERATPIVNVFAEAYGEFARLKGVYAAVGAHRDLVKSGPFSINAKASLGSSFYEEKDLSLDDLTGALSASYGIASSYAVSAIASGSIMSRDEGSMKERSVVWAGLGFGGSI